MQPKLEDVAFNREKFDAALRKIVAAKPLPLKDVIGTSPRSKKIKKQAKKRRA